MRLDLGGRRARRDTLLVVGQRLSEVMKCSSVFEWCVHAVYNFWRG